jgi:hypothetical protein
MVGGGQNSEYFISPLEMVIDDMNKAISQGIITDEYKNVEDLTDIFNYVLYGGEGDTEARIIEIGEKIINTISTENLEKYKKQQKIWENEIE